VVAKPEVIQLDEKSLGLIGDSEANRADWMKRCVGRGMFDKQTRRKALVIAAEAAMEKEPWRHARKAVEVWLGREMRNWKRWTF
jgi:hypothetical protein